MESTASIDAEKLSSRLSNGLGKCFVCAYGGITGLAFTSLSDLFLWDYVKTDFLSYFVASTCSMTSGFVAATIINCCCGKGNCDNNKNVRYDKKFIKE